MRTCYLTGLSITLLAVGLTLGAVGLHPAAPGSLLMRLGVLLATASIPPWHAAQSRRAADRVVQHDTDTYNAGYLQALGDVRRGLLDPCPPADGGPTGVTHIYARAHLRALPTHPERTAQ